MELATIAGSLRRDSYNRALLRAAGELAPSGVNVTHLDLRGVPLFDEDREDVDAGGPAVAALREAVQRADAILFGTPEYNQSMPGVLKNAIDWLSRDPSVLAGKPVAVIGATTGPWGTRYAQQMLRHVLGATGCIVMTSPMLFVRHAADAFDGTALSDAAIAKQLEGVVKALTQWARAFTARDLAVH